MINAKAKYPALYKRRTTFETRNDSYGMVQEMRHLRRLLPQKSV
jgi:hypothetical protein